jgi:hypothetical protein
MIQVPAKEIYFSFLHSVQNGSVAHPASLLSHGYWGSFLEVMQAELKADHSPACSPGIMLN